MFLHTRLCFLYVRFCQNYGDIFIQPRDIATYIETLRRERIRYKVSWQENQSQKLGNKSGYALFHETPCANSRNSASRLGHPSLSLSLLRSPPPPFFARPLSLTSPPDQCTPAGAVDDGVRGPRNIAHCTFSPVFTARAAREEIERTRLPLSYDRARKEDSLFSLSPV